MLERRAKPWWWMSALLRIHACEQWTCIGVTVFFESLANVDLFILGGPCMVYTQWSSLVLSFMLRHSPLLLSRESDVSAPAGFAVSVLATVMWMRYRGRIFRDFCWWGTWFSVIICYVIMNLSSCFLQWCFPRDIPSNTCPWFWTGTHKTIWNLDNLFRTIIGMARSATHIIEGGGAELNCSHITIPIDMCICSRKFQCVSVLTCSIQESPYRKSQFGM